MQFAYYILQKQKSSLECYNAILNIAYIAYHKKLYKYILKKQPTFWNMYFVIKMTHAFRKSICMDHADISAESAYFLLSYSYFLNLIQPNYIHLILKVLQKHISCKNYSRILMCRLFLSTLPGCDVSGLDQLSFLFKRSSSIICLVSQPRKL